LRELGQQHRLVALGTTAGDQVLDELEAVLAPLLVVHRKWTIFCSCVDVGEAGNVRVPTHSGANAVHDVVPTER